MNYTPIPENIGGRLVLRREDYDRDRPLWLRERKKSLGASEIAALVGLNERLTPLKIWLDKTSTKIERDEDMAEAAQWGLNLEHTVAQVFVKRNPNLGKLWPTPGLLRHEDTDYVHSTLDKLIVKRGSGPLIATGGIEVKTTGQFPFKKNWIDGVPPTKTIIQDQIQMSCTGLQRIHNPVLVGGQYMPDPAAYVDRDDEIIKSLLTVATDWWERYIINRNRPEPTIGDHGILADIYGENRGDIRKATRAELDLYSQVMDAKRRMTEAEADKDEATFKLKVFMKESTELEDVMGNTLATWRRSKPKRKINMDKMKLDHPDLIEEYSYTSESITRPFIVKEIEEA